MTHAVSLWFIRKHEFTSLTALRASFGANSTDFWPFFDPVCNLAAKNILHPASKQQPSALGGAARLCLEYFTTVWSRGETRTSSCDEILHTQQLFSGQVLTRNVLLLRQHDADPASSGSSSRGGFAINRSRCELRSLAVNQRAEFRDKHVELATGEADLLFVSLSHRFYGLRG